MSAAAVPALNLRGISSRDAQSPTPPHTPSQPAAVGTSTPHTPVEGADALLGCDVHSITDVATLQAKLLDAQRLFLALEHRYRRSLEAKQRQLTSLTAAIALNGPPTSAATTTTTGGSVGSPTSPADWHARPARFHRGVQVGFPSVPSSLSSTPRSTRGEAAQSARLRAAIAGRASQMTPRSTTYGGGFYYTASAQNNAAGSSYGRAQPNLSSNRPLTARVGVTTTTATGPTTAGGSLFSPRGSGATPSRDGASVAGTPSSPVGGYKPYQPATRRANNGTGTSRAITPRY